MVNRRVLHHSRFLPFFPPKPRSIIHHVYIYKPIPHVTLQTSSLSFTYGHPAIEQMQINKKIRNHHSILHKSLTTPTTNDLAYASACNNCVHVEILRTVWYKPFSPRFAKFSRKLGFRAASLSPPPRRLRHLPPCGLLSRQVSLPTSWSKPAEILVTPSKPPPITTMPCLLGSPPPRRQAPSESL